VFDMSTAYTFETTTPLIDATVNETLPLGDYRSLHSLPKCTRNSIIHWIKTGLSGGHMSGMMKSTFSFSDSHCMGRVRWRAVLLK